MKSLNELREKSVQLKSENPKLRNRSLANQLGISEAELLTLNNPHVDVIVLDGDWRELLKEIHTMGYVMALTRNESCVHERKGVYNNISFYGGEGNMGVAVNEDIDLRFFMNQWVHGLAVIMRRGKMADLYSFQFFNKEGEAVHKIFSTPDSDLDAYNSLVKKYIAHDQNPLVIEQIDEINLEDSADETSDVDIEAFQNDWKNLQDTHDFFGMLKKYELNRTRAVRIAPEGMTEKVDKDAVVRMLELAAERKVPIMCFVHSKGCVQIHSGPVKNLKVFGDWYNVLDSKFNLHLKTNDISETWIVKKPTKDGIVTSLELFDEEGQLITYFFGKRKPGIPELESWRKLMAEISRASVK
ncbi:hemin-degrading factor [Membranihabitans maritimus]|uniref:hemin-degrading factor n=1 Tax=Membranihabitans maritimus TaxID=2904244 RepID=UPI001F1FEB93|nr:ChuX/HutX family heme-like substrate-binding protein [Membranihabitans maritimus]